MNTMKRVAIYALLFACAALTLAAGDVFVLPADQSQGGTRVFQDSPFLSLTTLTSPANPIAVLARPDGSRFYVISSSTTDSIVILDHTLAKVLEKINLPVAPQAAGMSPDGKRLVVLAGRVHMYDTTTSGDDEIEINAQEDVGQNPIDVAFSLDSKWAFILSDESDVLSTFSLQDRSVEVQVGLPGTTTAVAAAPNGRVYVAGTNRLYELDGTTGQLKAQIELNGLPGKPVFTRDGRYAVLPNQLSLTGLAFLVDLVQRTVVSTVPRTYGNPELVLSQLGVVSNSDIYAVSTSGRTLVRLSVSGSNLSLATTGFPLATKADVRALAVSRELPNARYLFVATNGSLSRVALSSGAVDEQTFSGTPVKVDLAGAASTATPAGYAKYNDEQTLLAGATTEPLVLRVWDANGVPVFDKTVEFSTTTPDVLITPQSVQTSVDGLAQTRVKLPTAPGPIEIKAAVAGMSQPVTFVVTVAGGGGAGGVGLAMYSGNGQVSQRGSIPPDPLRVRLTDSRGNPIAGAEIEWAVKSGDGMVSPARSTTDDNGIAETDFLAPAIVPPSIAYTQTFITASAPNFPDVEFVVTTVPSVSTTISTPAWPQVTVLAPSGPPYELTGQAGQTLADAVRARIRAIRGEDIPNVGIAVDSGEDPNLPSAACAAPGGAALSDSSGIASCNLRFGPVVGSRVVRLMIGGRDLFSTNLLLTVTPGPPGLIQILSGNNQTGERNAILPLPLVAQVSDGYGHFSAGVAVTWEVVTPGTATILSSGTTTVTDVQGRVTARVQLGSTPGQVQIRVRAGTVQAVFTLTVRVNISTLRKVSGDNQAAVVNTAFAQPLVVELLDDQSRGIAGANITFARTSGSATITDTTVATDASGRASTTVTAGGAPGSVVITASVADQSVTFNLTVYPAGPVLARANIRNAISGDLGVTPGGIIAIYGQGLATGIQGSVVANGGYLIGSLPTTLAQVQVQMGGIDCPIYHVNNINGQEFVVVQAPFSLALGTTSVKVTVAGGSTTIDGVEVKNYQPGIFETLGPSGQRWAVLTKADGSYVTADNPVRRGVDTRLRMYCGGLGQTTPALSTNSAGVPNQALLAKLILGVRTTDGGIGGGVNVVSAEAMVGMVGVYVVTFDVPANINPGLDQDLVVAIANADGSPNIDRIYYSAIPRVQ